MTTLSSGGGAGSRVAVGIDWINGTFPLSQRIKIIRLLSAHLGESVTQDKGANTYRRSLRWATGAILAWTDDRDEAWVSVNGDSLSLVAPGRQRRFLRQLSRLGLRCTRLDVRADLSRGLLTIDVVRAAVESKNVQHFKRYDPRRVVRDVLTGDIEGDQVNLGRRGSDGGGCYLRIYDKGLESKGEIDSVRIEPELSGAKSDLAFRELAASPSDSRFIQLLGEIVGGCVDFRERLHHVHLDRMKRLPFWSRIVDELGTASLKVYRVLPPLQRALEYLRDNWDKTLAAAAEQLRRQGQDGYCIVCELIMGMLDSGHSKLRVGAGVRARELTIDLERLLMPERKLVV